MPQIIFSAIEPTADRIAPLLAEFERATRITVHLERMNWQEAWRNLLHYAFHGDGPDISEIGSTWTSSLMLMNTLRPFKLREVQEVGLPAAFVPAAWQSAFIPNDPRMWALPLTVDTYLTIYRRDLLAKAGIDESTAFADNQAVANTLRALLQAGVPIPWAPNPGFPALSFFHMSASWIWGAGGDFVGKNGSRVLFNTPQSRHGLSEYLSIFRYLKAIPADLQEVNLFPRGKAAMTFNNPQWIRSMLLRPDLAPEVKANLGVCSLPNTPFIGGTNLVIWRSVQAYPEREQAALRLAQFLLDRRSQINLSQTVNIPPPRMDILPDLNLTPPFLATTLRDIFARGRSFAPVPLWSRIENLLTTEINAAIHAIRMDPGANIEASLANRLQPLERQLNLILGS